ncbi:MAG: ABC-type transport auxiliary lipoprotein family protein [Gallionellaceae bacterium]|nr:ABC-type transport auxiliary lipoprotein family protein [Gallionellaceae bacterium]
MKKLFWLLPLIWLSACSGLPGPAQPSTYYVLTDPGPVEASPKTLPGVLLLREMDASAFYQEPRLAYSRIPGTRANYEFAYWTELPAKRLTWLLRQRLEAAGTFVAVAPLSGGVVGDYQLNTRLIDFYHDAATPPGEVLLLVEAELVRRDRGVLLGRRIFVSQQPVAAFDAAAAAEAMNRAANQVLDEIVAWLGEANG